MRVGSPNRVSPSASVGSMAGAWRWIKQRLTPAMRVSQTRELIGAPAIPCVKVGDQVVENQMIAEASEGLSVPHFAPITGRVTYVDNQTIVIHA